MAYNRVILMGRITHDLELKTTPSGVNVCTFQIAVDRRFQTKGEERKSDYFRVEAWRQQAEFVTKYFGKGRMILVEGELHNDDYTDKNGQQVRSVRIVADQIAFTGEKAQNGGYGGGYNDYGTPPPARSDYGAPAGAAPAQGGNSAPADFSSADKDDDYPF